LASGKVEEKRDTVPAMLKEGLSIDLIARLIQLDKRK